MCARARVRACARLLAARSRARYLDLDLAGGAGGDAANFEAMAASMLSEEQSKMNAIEEKRKKAEEIQKKLQEAEVRATHERARRRRRRSSSLFE